jgi:hypothetical protein
VEKFIEDIRGCHLFCVDLQGSVEAFDTLSWKSDKVPMSIYENARRSEDKLSVCR